MDPEGLGAARRLIIGPGGWVALAGDGPELRLLDISDGRLARSWTAGSPITALAADPAMAACGWVIATVTRSGHAGTAPGNHD